ncbi:hypothetical protein NDU88_001963 [Pleurodeles waltl]|uniref:Uncharacterized protein n=1 Tax=Pleurodeles waltl TaxID=8319 RepID=A0AAV7UVP5_PLEWA|nr:hypothetical protein NDU88_001963 [Pleurodeles waltl]
MGGPDQERFRGPVSRSPRQRFFTGLRSPARSAPGQRSREGPPTIQQARFVSPGGLAGWLTRVPSPPGGRSPLRARARVHNSYPLEPPHSPGFLRSARGALLPSPSGPAAPLSAATEAPGSRLSAPPSVGRLSRCGCHFVSPGPTGESLKATATPDCDLLCCPFSRRY